MMSAFFPVDAFSSGSDDDAGSSSSTNFYEYCHDCDRSDSCSPHSSSNDDISDDIFSNDCCDEAINFGNFICCGNSCLNKITGDERELYGIIGK